MFRAVHKAFKAVKDSVDSGSVALLLLMAVVGSALAYGAHLDAGDKAAAAKAGTPATQVGGKTS